VAQAYVEALSRFLAEHHGIPLRNDARERYRRLHRRRLLSDQALNAATAVLADRNDFHHLNKQVPQDFYKLEARAEECINHLYVIESDVFGYCFSDIPGKLQLRHPEYWPSGSPGTAQIGLRQLW
jgi:hypothetical protein